MAVPQEASDQNGAEFPVCVCAADGNCFLRNQPCESSDDFCDRNPVSGSNRDDRVDRALQRTVYSWNVVSAVRYFSGTQSETVGENFALCSAGCSRIVVRKLGRCLRRDDRLPAALRRRFAGTVEHDHGSVGRISGKNVQTGRGQRDAGAVSEKCAGCGAVGQKYLHFV